MKRTVNTLLFLFLWLQSTFSATTVTLSQWKVLDKWGNQMLAGGALPSGIQVQAKVTGANLVAGNNISLYMVSTVFIGLPFRVTTNKWTMAVTRASGTKVGADCTAMYTGGTITRQNYTLLPLNGACNISSGVVFTFVIPSAYCAESPSNAGYYTVKLDAAGATGQTSATYGNPCVIYASLDPRNSDNSASYLIGGRQPSFLNIGFTVTMNITAGVVFQLISSTSYPFRLPGSTTYAVPITGTGCTAVLTSTGTGVTNITSWKLTGSACLLWRNVPINGSQFQLPAGLLNVHPIDSIVRIGIYMTVGSMPLSATTGNPTTYTTTNDCGAWSSWSSCSATCGTGYTYRTRIGEPDYCASTIAVRACNTVACGCAPWSDWGACTATCGGNISRYRLGSTDCNVATVDTQNCGPVSCSCPWTQTDCSSTCGSGVRTRTITPASPSVDCGTNLVYDVVCNETFTTESLSCSCKDLDWTDRYGSTCEDYVNNQWCTSSGGYGPGWDASQPGFSSFNARGINDNIAPTACCGCGKNKCVKDVVLLIDQSSSIALSDWAKTKQYIWDRVNQTKMTDDEGNRFAVVQFDVAASVLCPMTWDKAFLLKCISAITFPAGSATATSAGLDLANTVFTRYSNPNRTRVVELLTDGSPNRPTSNPEAAAYNSSYILKDAGVVVVTIGMGIPCLNALSTDCLNQEVLNTIASDPDSSYAVLLASYDSLSAMSLFISSQCTPELDGFVSPNPSPSPFPSGSPSASQSPLPSPFPSPSPDAAALCAAYQPPQAWKEEVVDGCDKATVVALLSNYECVELQPSCGTFQCAQFVPPGVRQQIAACQPDAQ
eukprot:EG_transcript_1439